MLYPDELQAHVLVRPDFQDYAKQYQLLLTKPCIILFGHVINNEGREITKYIPVFCPAGQSDKKHHSVKNGSRPFFRTLIVRTSLLDHAKQYQLFLTKPCIILFGRGREIRTPDILLPKQARYQTALYPDIF